MGETMGRETASRRGNAKRKVGGGVVVAIVVSLLAALVPMFTSPASAQHAPTFVAGNKSCGQLGYEDEIKINGVPANTTYNITVDGVTGTITITNSNGFTFDFTSTIPVSAVFVKAADGGNLYEFDPATTGHTGLISPPTNPGGPQAQVSHVSFCFDDTPITPAADLTIEKTATPTFARDFDWTIVKTADPATVTTSADTTSVDYDVTVTKGAAQDSGYQVAGVITIFNPNTQTVTITSISDAIEDNVGAASCTLDFNGATAGTGTAPGTVVGGGTILVDYVCTFASAAAATGTDSNTARVGWTDPVSGAAKSAAAIEDYTWPTDPAAAATTDDCVDVDDLFDSVDPADTEVVGNTCVTHTFEYSRTVDVPETGCVTYDNTATVHETEGDSTDDASVEVCREYDDLTIAKTADTSFDRDFDWTIVKTASPALITTANNTATFSYSVTATKGAAQDSGHEVDGTITIDNPNDVAVTITDIADSLESSATADCTLDFNGATAGLGTEPTSIAANSQIVVGYHCTFTSAAAALATTTNTASVSWTDPGTLGAKSDDDTATYAWGDPDTTTDDCVDVTDAFNGGAEEDLGNVCVTTTFDPYTRTVAVPANGCVDYTNLAVVHEDNGPGDDDDATVRACRATNDGFTRGFWTNKNGAKWIQANQPAVQAMLAAYSNVLSGVGSSASSIKATIEGSNSSGDAFTQFRAQFLATALSVAKSPGGSLGGQYVSGPGGDCMTITEWLVYGNTNYGSGTLLDTKAELLELKDLYDAVNNNVAPLCTP